MDKSPISEGQPHFLAMPPHYDPNKVGQIWRVPYADRAREAVEWAKRNGITPAANDRFRIALIAIDFQNTFCLPGFELFVAGRSGNGAVDDNRRLCEFIYHNLSILTHIAFTLDSHQAMQIFHPVYLVDEQGNHPSPLTLVSYEDVQQGRWRFNPDIASSLGLTPQSGQEHLLHYTSELMRRQKYELMIWPYHAMVGGIGHALVSSLEEAIFFHTMARSSQADITIKGQIPNTESYSAIGPEVLKDATGKQIAQKNEKFIQKVIDYDAVVIAGEAKSHCVTWTIDDLLSEIQEHDPVLAKKVYLLDDCTSSVVVPNVIDYTEAGEASFQHFSEAGMHIVNSTDPVRSWPGIKLN
jgi:nicotinamidase-related amidase